jgi:NADH-quinone oxidoreductase subunit N
MLGSAFAKKGSYLACYLIFVAGILGAISFLLVGNADQSVSLVQGVFISDHLSRLYTLLILVGTLGAGLMNIGYGERHHILPEFYALILLSAIGGVILVSTTELITAFIALELLSLGTYVLVGLRRQSQVSSEASLKYFIMGGIASAVFLYGVSLLYGATGSLSTAGIKTAMMAWSQGEFPLMASIGMAMVGAGLLFKLGAVPFQVWVPDVYSGAPSPVTGYMITAVKIAAFGLFLRIAEDFFQITSLMSQGTIFYKFLWVVAAVSMMLGSFVGLMQTQIKRLLAYSTIAHTGYILMAFLVFGASQSTAVFGSMTTYLVYYLIANLGLFAALTLLSRGDGEALRLSDLSGLAQRKPWVAFAMSFFLLSLAGIPLTAGFIGKFQLFLGVAKSGGGPLVVLAVLSSMISLYYYLRPMVYMYMKDASGVDLDDQNPYIGAMVVLALALVLNFYFGIQPLAFKGPF